MKHQQQQPECLVGLVVNDDNVEGKAKRAIVRRRVLVAPTMMAVNSSHTTSTSSSNNNIEHMESKVQDDGCTVDTDYCDSSDSNNDDIHSDEEKQQQIRETRKLMVRSTSMIAVPKDDKKLPSPIGTSTIPSTVNSTNKTLLFSSSLTNASSMMVSIFNLVNNVAGAGMLTLPAGQASGGGTGWFPAVLIATSLGYLSATTFYRIGYCCELLQEPDFKGLWSRSIGPKTTYIVDMIISFLCCSVCIIYSGILGDVFTPLFYHYNILPKQYNHRSSNITLITLFLLFPMSLLKNLSAFKYTSFLGFISVVYTTMFICYRAFDGSYDPDSGYFVTPTKAEHSIDAIGFLPMDYRMDAARFVPIAKPTFHHVTLWNVNFATLIMMSNYGLAYNAHYNSPIFYRELNNTSSAKFSKMVYASYTILIGLYVITMVAGYKTFGDSCKGNILLNYHPNDILSTIARIATGCSILFGYPLVMTGARESIINLITCIGSPSVSSNATGFLDETKVVPNSLSDTNRCVLVMIMLTIITYISISVEDVSLVVGVAGATLGSLIVYICPTLVYTKTIALSFGTDSAEYRKALISSCTIIPFGIMIASFGAYMALTQ